MSWGKYTVSLVAGPPILDSVGIFQFFVIWGVRVCRGGGKGESVIIKDARVIQLDSSSILPGWAILMKRPMSFQIV